jgi:tetratricopeptide (TPR) repeat protein
MNDQFVSAYGQGKYQAAFEAAEQAWSVAKETPNLGAQGRFTLLNNLAIGCAVTERLERAEEVLLDALKLVKELPLEQTSALFGLSNLAFVYEQLGRNELAESLLKTASEKELPLSMVLDTANVVRSPIANLCRLYLRQSKFEEAAEAQEKAIELYNVAWRRDPVQRALFTGELGNYQLMAGAPEKAIRSLEQCVQVITNLQGTTDTRLGPVLTILAAAYAFEGDISNAGKAMLWARK